MKKLLMLLCLGVSSHSVWANTLVEMQTNLGNIEIELYDDKAPMSVNNFKGYIKSGFYKETIFHRVIPGFMAQGGGMTANMQEKKTRAPIKNEAGNGIANTRGTLAMARTSNPDSATSQFFINVADNNFLNRSPGNPGYAVFGKVVKGMDVVDRIVQAPTSNYGMHQNVPKQPIKIVDIKIKNSQK
ncbi:TPA: peptidylprolyl isomerase [Acinetobacter baumannii]|nr:peptidylprolyl isomerase [Acinetobacter baumannii]